MTTNRTLHTPHGSSAGAAELDRHIADTLPILAVCDAWTSNGTAGINACVAKQAPPPVLNCTKNIPDTIDISASSDTGIGKSSTAILASLVVVVGTEGTAVFSWNGRGYDRTITAHTPGQYWFHRYSWIRWCNWFGHRRRETPCLHREKRTFSSSAQTVWGRNFCDALKYMYVVFRHHGNLFRIATCLGHSEWNSPIA